MNQTKITILCCIACCFSMAIAGAKTNEQNQSVYDLLFVGNSLTLGNNLPALVNEYAATKNIKINTTMVAKGGYAIVDHWAEGRVQGLIRSGQFDYVIIQQGPSSQFDGYEMLVNGGADYARLSAEHGAQLAYFMVWPSIARYHSFPGVIRNYTAGARANNALLLPVGSVWKAHIDATADYSYYGSDGFHPSLAGSQKAAEVIVDTLFPGSACSCQRVSQIP